MISFMSTYCFTKMFFGTNKHYNQCTDKTRPYSFCAHVSHLMPSIIISIVCRSILCSCPDFRTSAKFPLFCSVVKLFKDTNDILAFAMVEVDAV